MKRIVSLLLLLGMLLPVVLSLAACEDIFFSTVTPPSSEGTTDNGDANEDGNNSGTGGTGTKPGQGGTKPGDSTTGGGDSSDEPVDRTEDYAYTPYLPATMPEIRVQTDKNDLSFATSITTFAQKWNGDIQYADCTVSVGNCESAYTLTNADAQIKVRGNYTITFPKQPFRIKFTEKQSMLGMNEGQKYKSWVLLAEWKDSSLLFDPTAYYLGNTILGSDGYYCTDYRLVKLYLDGSYWGVYVLAEQQQTGTGRVDIPEPEKNYLGADIGYFFEYDGYYKEEEKVADGDPTFTIDYNSNATFKDQEGDNVEFGYFRGYTIKSDIYSDTQITYLRNYVNNTYKAVYDTLFTSKNYVLDNDGNIVASTLSDEKAVGQMIDLQSLVDTYILNEICCDYDLHWSSFYMSADLSATGNRKLTFCAPWDFDTAFGSKNAKYDFNSTEKYSNKDACPTAETPYAGVNRNPWLILLINQEWFMDAVKEKWAELVQYRIPHKAIEQIDLVCVCYREDLKENTNRAWYDSNLRRMVYHKGDPSPTKELITEIANCTTQIQAADRLSGWLTKRFNYLNREWGNGKNLFG